jgi:hypothetical protein
VSQRTSEQINEQISASTKLIRELSFEHKKFYGLWPDALFDGQPAMPPQHLVRSCQVLTSRVDLLRRIPQGGRFAEVGTLDGEFAKHISHIVKPDELHIFDLTFDKVTEENKVILDGAGVRWHEGFSWAALNKMPESYFDVVYVDGDHSYESVVKDLEAAHRVTKAGGRIICNDYTGWSQAGCIPYGVYWAVNAFASKHKLPFEFLSLQVNGFHDVGLIVQKK